MLYFKNILHPQLQEPKEIHSIEELEVARLSWHESLNKKISSPNNTSKPNNTLSELYSSFFGRFMSKYDKIDHLCNWNLKLF